MHSDRGVTGAGSAAMRALLYVAQGCWAEVQSDEEQASWARANVILLYRCGVFSAFLELLYLEIE